MIINEKSVDDTKRNFHYIIRLIREILIDHERISFLFSHAKNLERHLWVASLLAARTCLKLHIRYTASVYHYLRHLSRTETRVYTKRLAFTQDLSLFTPYKSRNTVLFLGGKRSLESTYPNTPSPFVDSFASIESKWFLRMRSKSIVFDSFICLREKEREREGGGIQ